MARPSEDVLGIQYLRGIAATIVVFYHTGVNTPDFAWPLSLPRGAGSSGVDIFFVISGFIMTYITSVKPVPLGSFVKHRLIRVVPLYWFFNAVIIVGGLIYPAAILAALHWLWALKVWESWPLTILAAILLLLAQRLPGFSQFGLRRGQSASRR